jgi:hypothetical protein
VKWVVFGVRAGEWRRSTSVHSTEDVVVGEKVAVSQLLHRRPNPPNGGRVSTELRLRVHDPDLHTGESARRAVIGAGYTDDASR